MSNKYLFLDTETTGTEEKDRLFEVAYIYDTDQGTIEHEALFHPGMKIPLMSTSITDVTDDMVEDKPGFTDSPEYKILKTLLEEQEYILIAHNAPFDVGMIEREGIKVPRFIDTLKLAHQLTQAEELESMKLNYLRHYYQIPNSGGALHRALTDTEYLKALFFKLVEDLQMSDEKMMEVSKQMTIPTRVNFGKHRGKHWKELPADYLSWIIEKSDLDQDTKDAAHYYLTGQMPL